MPHSLQEIEFRPAADLKFIQAQEDLGFTEDLGSGSQKILTQFLKDAASFDTQPQKIFKFELNTEQDSKAEKTTYLMRVWFQTEQGTKLYTYNLEQGGQGSFKVEAL